MADSFKDAFLGDSSYYSARHYNDRQSSLFGELTYHFSPSLRAIAGLRVLRASQQFTREGDRYYAGGPSSVLVDSSARATTPRFALSWDADKTTTLYTNVAKGFRLGSTRLSNVQDIFQAHALGNGSNRSSMWGGRIVFDKRRPLRDPRRSAVAQDLLTHNGKTVRPHDDGRVPMDNPFVGTPHALPEIWTLGHCNAQGMAFHPTTGDLWQNEHGPKGGDELNAIAPGMNYGWPAIGCYRLNSGSSGNRVGELRGVDTAGSRMSIDVSAFPRVFDIGTMGRCPMQRSDGGGSGAVRTRTLIFSADAITHRRDQRRGRGRCRVCGRTARAHTPLGQPHSTRFPTPPTARSRPRLNTM